MRALAVFTLGLTVALAGPVRAQDRTEPPPPPGKDRLIQLGPEAVVLEDDHGNIRMVDEPAHKLGNGQAAGAAFGAVGGGVAGIILMEPRAIAAGTIYGAGEPLEDTRPARSPEVPRPIQSPP
jgi:hypothetical protein